MKISDIGIIFGICSTLVSGTAYAATYYLEHEFVPISSFTKMQLRETNKEIRELKWLKDNGGLTPRQQWQLEQLYGDVEELKQELAE